jgi:hypothetical protein
MTIKELSDLYQSLGEFSLEFEDIDSIYLKNFSKKLNAFDRMIGEASEDEYWRRKLLYLKRFRFDICSAPIGHKDIQSKIITVLDAVGTDLLECEKSYPGYSAPYKDILESIDILLNINYDNFLGGNANLFLKRIGKKGEVALLIKEHRLIPLVESYIATYLDGNSEVLTPNKLAQDTVFDSIITFGPTRWFPDYVFSSPRTKKMLVVQYSWDSSRWNYEPLLPKCVFHQNFPKSIEYSEQHLEPLTDDYSIEVPTIDISNIILNINSEISKNPDQEIVDAKLFQLQNDTVVFLDIDKNAKVQVLLPEETEHPIKKIKVSELDSGSFVLLKTSGGGDYIIPLADQILDKSEGISSSDARELQEKWKKLLRQRVRVIGHSRSVQELDQNGSRKVSDMNLRNWMSYRSIKTQKYDDFFAIMKFIGLDNESERIWKVMRIINNAHRQAGMYIRKLLIDEINISNLDKLLKEGIQTFSLKDNITGEMTAYRVTRISEEIYNVPSSRIGSLELLD